MKRLLPLFAAVVLLTPRPANAIPVSFQTSPGASPGASSAQSTADIEAEGDARFARRADGAVNGVALRPEVDAAIALYRKARAQAPDDLDLLAKLIRALHFRGAYTGATPEEKKAIFEEGRDLGQAAIDRLEADAKAARGMSRVEFLRARKGAALLYLWTAGHWGEWALVRGKLAAARSGVAGRVRDLAQAVADIDPAFEDAAGYRILGRLHSEAPKIPFITGWVSHDKGVELLRRSLAAAPSHPVTGFFLAEALLEHRAGDPQSRAEALRLLDQVARSNPRPGTLLEDRRYATMAAERLEALRRAAR